MHYQINFEKRGAYEDHHIRQAYQSEDNLFLIENQMHKGLRPSHQAFAPKDVQYQ